MPLIKLKHIAIPTLTLLLNACAGHATNQQTAKTQKGSEATPVAKTIEEKDVPEGCTLIKAPQNPEDVWLIKEDVIFCPEPRYPPNINNM